MANETTFSLISSYLPVIVEATSMHLMKATFMPQTVQVFTDRVDMLPRKGDKYSQGSVEAITEGTDLSNQQAFTRTVIGTITPSRQAARYFLTDDRIRTDNNIDVLRDLVDSVTYTLAEKIDTDLLGLFTSFTGGTVGTGGSALTWENIMAGRSRLRNAGVPGPYTCVLHEYAWFDLSTARTNAVPIVIEQSLQEASDFYVGSFGDVAFYATGLISAAGTVTQGIYSRQAIALDMRQGVQVELERDASMFGNEIIVSMVYGKSVWRTEYGVQIRSDATAPS